MFSYPRGYDLAKISKQHLFAVITAVQMTPVILLNQMSKSSAHYHLVIDSDKSLGHEHDEDALSKALVNVTPPIKLPGKPQPTNGEGEHSTY